MKPMHYTAQIEWQRGAYAFVDKRYSRKHVLRFDGGIEVPGSSSPHVVPLPYSDAAAVDPEEAFVAALSSCHMLWFLDFAQRGKWCVDSYVDDAIGVMEPDRDGRIAITTVTLRPNVTFADPQPTQAEVSHLHYQAHEACFIANSVKSDVRCEPVF